jgi:hypothetical protein
LRLAMRMSVRAFAAFIEVSDRMVSKREAGGDATRPRPVNQGALDTTLSLCTPEMQARFAGWPERTAQQARRANPAGRWMMHAVLEVCSLEEAMAVTTRVLAAAAGVAELQARETSVSPENRPFTRYGVRSPHY